MIKDWTGNGTSVWKTLGASNHTDNEREADDYYATDPIAIDKLLSVERPHMQIWECAAGGGHLSKRLTENGFNVCSTDIKERGYPLDARQDFLAAMPQSMPLSGEFDILTNPPYKYATEFVHKALELLPHSCNCYMFLKLTFLEGKRRRVELFDKTPPRNVYVFSDRMVCAKNGDFESMKHIGSAVSYAWFVWQKSYTGTTEVRWI